MALCALCATVDFGALIETACTDQTGNDWADPGIRHHGSLHALQEAAKQQCGLCRLLHTAVGQTYHESIGPYSLHFETIPCVDEHGVARRVCCFLVYFDLTEMNGCYLLIHSKRDNHEWIGTRLAGSSPGPADWQLWLQDCTQQHSACPPIDERPLPTRVLEIPDALDAPLRLVDGAGKSGRYVALSHCWGDTMPLTTTISTLDERKRGISWASLPTTFRDAAKVTRSLGFQYLWIDSLCIIQGDEEDWQQECSRMYDVYTNSILTIAADAAANSTVGMLDTTAGSSLSTACELPVRWPSSRIQELLVLTILPESQDGDSPFYPNQSALASRGWALQERLLPPRILHFGLNGAYFECNSGQRTEKLRYQLPVGFLEDLNAAAPKYALKAIGPLDLLGTWYELVSIYTSCHLTNGKDRLPAISGIAREIASKLRGYYIAGLWTNDIAFGLSWRPNVHSHSTSKVPSSIKGPTWSWASYKRPASYSSHLVAGDSLALDPQAGVLGLQTLSTRISEITWISCVELLQSHSTLHSSDDPYGEVRDGHLTLSGYVQPISITVTESIRTDSWLRMLSIHRPGSNTRFARAELDEAFWDEGGWYGAVCLLLGVVLWPQDPAKGVGYLALVLMPTLGQNQWERIGVVQQHFHRRELLRPGNTVAWFMREAVKELDLV